MNFKASGKRFILLGTILAVHILAVFGPAGCYLLQKKQHENDDIPFKVKLGGFEPSHAPELGEPERVRPNPDANVPPPPDDPAPEPEPEPAPEPAPTPVPAPDDAAQKKAEEQALLKKKAEQQRKQRELAERKRKLEQQKKKKLEEQKKKKLEEQKKRKLAEQQKKKKLEEEKKRRLEQQRKRRLAEQQRKKLEAERKKKADSGVYHDKKWDNWDPNKPATAPGGKNFNKNVKIGNKDRGQKIGEVDGRTPAGGASAGTDNYIKGISETIHRQWRPPAGVFVTAETAVEITVSISKSGAVNCWISKRSSNPAVNRSAEDLIRKLKQLPRPPEAVRFTVRLIQEY